MTVSVRPEMFHIEGLVRFRTAEEGGRKTGVGSGYRSQFHFAGRDCDGYHVFPDIPEGEKVFPGTQARALIVFIEESWKTFLYHRLKIGCAFAIREGAHVVADGHVTRFCQTARPLPPGWVAVDDAEADLFEAELQRETLASHQLAHLRFQALARRDGEDDVVFWTSANKTHKRFAVVHLTWQKETDPRWPSFQVFADWDDWLDVEEQHGR